MGASSSIAASPGFSLSGKSSKSTDKVTVLQAKISAMKLVYGNTEIFNLFLSALALRNKREVLNFYEELESLKRIAPLSADPNISYQFKAILWTSRLLQDFFIDPYQGFGHGTPNSVVNEAVVVGLQPFLTYTDDRVSNPQLHELIAQCQKNLFERLVPDFDYFIDSKPFKDARLLKNKNTHTFFDEFDKCFASLDSMSAITFDSANSNSLDEENNTSICA
jgi:hypothetical protein